MQIDRRLWDAGIALFATKGFAATGIREIADQAGLSVSALYYYVHTKEELLARIMLDGQKGFVSSGRRVVERLDKPEERLVGLVQLHVLTQARYRREAVVLDTEIRSLSPEWREKVVDVRDQYESLWRDTLEAGIAGKVFAVPSARTARLALLEMCNGVAYWYTSDGPLTREQLAQEFADLALALVRASRGGRQITAKDLGLPDLGWITSLVDAVFFIDDEVTADTPSAEVG